MLASASPIRLFCTEIILVQTATGYEGRAGGAGGTLAFTVSINSATGETTVTQNAALDHPVSGSTATDHDDVLTLNSHIKVVQTITDGDGDTATATSTNALDITFKDDGPTAGAPTTTTA
ncbi:MAG TPA: hypothetical protein EYP76_00345, partial [Thiomicrorhabdus sp.]|nr:hypothetical protein [Thiomicrorhabdus sp.]